MKTYFKIFLLSLSLFITSYSDDMFTYKDDETETQKSTNPIIQEITGAGDCLTNKGWSWSNKIATTIDGADTCYFSFKSTVSGKLSFAYKSIFNKSTYGLKVIINETIYFQKGEVNSSYYYESASIGTVKEGEIINFTGRNFAVKDIKIVEESK